MLSSELRRLTVALAITCALVAAPNAQAQQQANGFGVERFSQSAPGAGWWVMDDLELRGGLGGAVALTLGAAGNPYRVTDGTQHLAVVSNQSFIAIGGSITYDRWRFYLDLSAPLVVSGESGTVGAYTFIGPSVNPGSSPDVLSDARLGVDVRIYGAAGGRFRFGMGAQLFVPFGNRGEYESDGTFRGAARMLVAGDVGHFTYAAHLGVHIRPLDDAGPGAPKGSELLFGGAVGARLALGERKSWALIFGPEIFGASAFRLFFGRSTTALEGLLSARVEGRYGDKVRLRVKLGVGTGLYQHFGAPDWRVVAGIELWKVQPRGDPERR